MAEPAGRATTELTFSQVLQEELKALVPDRIAGGSTTAPAESALYHEIHALANEDPPRPLTALCLSGGGIRSATFSLGVMQGLARCGLLARFDYLSTVSGGGYIGSWLTAWIKRKAGAHAGSDPYAAVQAELAGAQLKPGADQRVVAEAPAIAQLREYSHYLAPESGFLSADFWSLIATVLRNIILNWFVLIPVLIAALSLPRLMTAGLTWPLADGAPWWLFAVGFVACAWTVGYASFQRVLAIKPINYRASQSAIVTFGIVPLWIAAVVLSIAWAWAHLRSPETTAMPMSNDMLAFVAFGAAAMLLGWLGYAAAARASKKVDRDLLPKGLAWLAEPLCFTTAGAVGGAILRLAAHVFDGRVIAARHVAGLTYAMAAPSMFVLSFTLAATIFVGLASKIMDELDREWLSRFGAWALMTATAWSAGGLAVLLLPYWLAKGVQFWIATAATGGSGLLTILGGLSKRTLFTPRTMKSAGADATAPKDQNRWLSVAVRIALPVFVVLFVVGLSLFTDFLVALATDTPFDLGRFVRSFPDAHLRFPYARRTAAVALVAAAGGVIASLLVGINKFSLHAMYRNRLVRAYLGASRGRVGVSEGNVRHPDPFIGFDPDDDLALCNSAPAGPRRLFHVINMALNIVSGQQLAWQERKAESLTATSLHVGTYWLGYRRSGDYASRRMIASEKHPLTVGTAMAISGAAASPNMGYHSSAVLSFLMTLFNARLGWWLGNPGPAGEQTYMLESPQSSLQPLFAEALGQTDERHPYIYASDGGHFENLGLYEMVRRRCRVIVVVDAGADPECAYEDLSGAIRKIRSDMGISIDVPDEPARRIYARSGDAKKNEAGKMIFTGTVHYSDVDAPRDADNRISAADRMRYDGRLVYIKPAFYGRAEPLDIANYAAGHLAFPHDTTADQFFSESQFESYRALGAFAVAQATDRLDCHGGAPFDRFLKSVEEYVARTPVPAVTPPPPVEVSGALNVKLT